MGAGLGIDAAVGDRKPDDRMARIPNGQEARMTPRERFIAALRRKPIEGRIPHFEVAFFLTMEAFGKVHPKYRYYDHWDQMTERERQLHREDVADVYIRIAQQFEHSAINLGGPFVWRLDETVRLIELIRERTGDRYFLMMNNDPTFAIPPGNRMVEFCTRIAEDPTGLKAEAEQRLHVALERAEELERNGGLDGFIMCSDYCFNSGPFLSPNQLSEFVTPFLARAIEAYRQMGFFVIKHTDGNIMPIIDQLVQAKPHALHSLDPQAGVDIAEVKKRYGAKLCLIGNVDCAVLSSGTDADCVRSAHYALRSGMPDGGYIFSTSNCIHTGLPLKRYNLILDVWRQYAYGNSHIRKPATRPTNERPNPTV